MLKTLAGRDPGETKKLLTSATDLLLPHPREESGTVDPAVEALLAEVRKQVKVRPEDQSEPARAAVLNFLAKQFAEYLSSARPTDIRARLGDRGDLPASLYRLHFPPVFREAQKWGIKRSHVENAVYFPDAMEHLLPEKLPKAGYPAASLYGKVFGEPSDPHRYTMLVITQRERDVQSFTSAWRVYHSDVDVSHARTLLEILRAFVNVYGLDITIAGTQTEKLVVYRSFQLPKDSKPAQLLQIQVAGRMPAFAANQFMRVSPSGLVEVAIAFAIDLAKHGRDLERHGVKVEI